MSLLIKSALIRYPDADGALWRYLDLAKFIQMLETRSLIFMAANHFEDPYEGVVPGLTRAGAKNLLGDHLDNAFTSLYEARKHIFVNCWSGHAQESLALWRIYVPNGLGVAVRTSAGKLSQALASSKWKPVLAHVNYVDYASHEISLTEQTAVALFHKRICFAYENEVRAVFLEENPRDSAIEVGVDLAALIDSVIISPNAPVWFFGLIDRILFRYIEGVTPIRSSIGCRPLGK